MPYRTPFHHLKAAVTCAGIAVIASTGAARAFDDAAQIALGQTEYMTQCASCHGASGHGDGPVASVLVKKPLDLTLIAQRYSGQFPQDAIRQLIDGRNMINPHGDRGMPVWGERYFQSALERSQSVPHDVDAQALAYGRVTALIKFMESIQQE